MQIERFNLAQVHRKKALGEVGGPRLGPQLSARLGVRMQREPNIVLAAERLALHVGHHALNRDETRCLRAGHANAHKNNKHRLQATLGHVHISSSRFIGF